MMSRFSTNFRRFALVAGLVSLFAVAGCSGNKSADESSVPNAPSVDENILGDSDSGRALGMVTIHFPYDSFVLDEEAKSQLKNNADILKDKASARVQIEGHCDSRGGIQYNIALGEKRAKAVRKFLIDLGVSADRLTTISYGKERLIDPSNSEEAHGKNRRANFAITSR